MLLLDDASTGIADPYLARALALAQRGRGATSPNPVVGCVIVRGDRIVGEGYHPRAGQAHAEVFALADAGELARGADVYVTLEPCAHHGRTPPCVDALVAAGVASVTIGMRDPNPDASGGLEALRSAGIEVRISDSAEPFANANAGWLKRLAVGLPAVTVKIGVSLDGALALRSGERASMTGPSGAEVTRLLRSRTDAVVVGASTVAVDDPELTVRDSRGTRAEHQPLRVVLCRTSVPPTDARVFADRVAPTIVLVPEDLAADARALLSSDVGVVTYDGSQGLTGALRSLGNRGINDALFEAGPTLLAAIVESDVADRLVVVTGGGFAGSNAPGIRARDVVDDLDALPRQFTPCETGIFGDVSVTVWEPSSVKSADAEQ